MNNLIVSEQLGQLVIDSRLIASSLGVTHEATMKTVEKYATELQEFGVLRFEIGKPQSPAGGRPERFAWLNENQATLLMSFSRNTAQVIELKVALVAAFSNAKNQLTSLTALPSGPSKELIAAREIREISDLLDDNPRLAQVLTDSIMNQFVERKQLPGTSEPLRGVAEIAVEMGFKIDASNRVKLGQFMAKQGFEPKKEKRLCNGVETPINCYPDTPKLREAIAAYFEH